MTLKQKAVVSASIFLLILAAGSAGHVVVTEKITERLSDDRYGAFELDKWAGDWRFSPREYIKVIPVPEQNESEKKQAD